MLEIEVVIFLMATGLISLIISLYLVFSSEKINDKKIEKEVSFDIKIFDCEINLILILYLAIVIILFVIGVFSDFLINSTIGLTIALIPIFTYLISYYKTKKEKED
jgi:ABC-type methionine transport system permease subunit